MVRPMLTFQTETRGLRPVIFVSTDGVRVSIRHVRLATGDDLGAMAYAAPVVRSSRAAAP